MNTTIIIPYNIDRGYLAEAIESVENQTKPCKLIVSHSPASCAINLQNGLDKVDTKYYAVLAEDDRLRKDFVQLMELSIKDHSFAYGYGQSFGLSEKLYRSSCYGLKDLLKHNTIHGGSVLYDTDYVISVGGYNTSLNCAEEYELHLRMLKNGCTFVEVAHAVYLYRYHEKQKSKVRLSDKVARDAEIERIKSMYR
jgi:glycosyltransferase involved in cell wall biosynthesis